MVWDPKTYCCGGGSGGQGLCRHGDALEMVFLFRHRLEESVRRRRGERSAVCGKYCDMFRCGLSKRGIWLVIDFHNGNDLTFELLMLLMRGQ